MGVCWWKRSYRGAFESSEAERISQRPDYRTGDAVHRDLAVGIGLHRDVAALADGVTDCELNTPTDPIVEDLFSWEHQTSPLNKLLS
jgi:hypothetical protein